MSDYVTRTDEFMASLGLETYRVGGSVRDELLHRRVKDADYMVRGASLPRLGSKLMGALHGSGTLKALKLRDGRQAGWRVSSKNQKLGVIEITLPRKEVSTGPGHRDFEIVLDPELSLAEDASRRDFSFNALYKPLPDGPIADPTNCGLYDLQHKLVRTTHPDSFRDDPLRTLRALRFVSTLGYDLATNTYDEMKLHADAVDGLTDKGVSGTVLDELCKILMGQDAVKALRLARDTGVLATILPELSPMIGFDQGSRYHDLTTDEHTFKALETAVHVDAPLRVRMALLFHDAGKPASAWVGTDGRKHYYEPDDETWYKICLADGSIHQGNTKTPAKPRDHEIESESLWLKAAYRLNAPRDLRRDVATLIRNHMVPVSGKVKGSKVRRDRVKFGDEMLRDLHLHRACDLTGKDRADKNHMKHIMLRERIREESAFAGIDCPSSVKELQINGKDVMKLGAEGKAIGDILSAVLDEVVCQPNNQTLSREWQLERAETYAKQRR
jgi:tRNA nucleotidyltransferase (CCA-adding enzyme)